ncbi:MAG: CPBP family glutamic-type intramembrane protease [Anaerolineales bacterium]|jgi:membrane protease YdiL (CAAX protease family)|nr:CPBP family glutamic-type intramembrane protease [Anaerolineales bacterium]
MQNSIHSDTRPIAATVNRIPYRGISSSSYLLKFGIVFLFFFALPYLVMWATNMPEAYKYYLITVLFLLSVAHSYFERKTLRELGLRLDTFKKSLFWHGVLIAILTLAIYIASINQLYRSSTQPAPSLSDTIFYFFISCPVQEFLYRSFLFSEMKRAKITNFWMQIFISAFAFSFFHIHHRDMLTLAVTFFIGAAWAIIYRRYPNLIAVALAHSSLGLVAILTKVV